MRLDIFSSDKTDLNLKNAMFRVIKTNDGVNCIDTIFFQYKGKEIENIIDYNKLSGINGVFCVRKEKSKYGFSKYKTFQGLMTRLHEDVRNYKSGK